MRSTLRFLLSLCLPPISTQPTSAGLTYIKDSPTSLLCLSSLSNTQLIRQRVIKEPERREREKGQKGNSSWQKPGLFSVEPQSKCLLTSPFLFWLRACWLPLQPQPLGFVPATLHSHATTLPPSTTLAASSHLVSCFRLNSGIPTPPPALLIPGPSMGSGRTIAMVHFPRRAMPAGHIPTSLTF